MSYFVDEFNYLFKSDRLRLSLLLIISIFLGYTLQPVPKLLNKIFNNSMTFKFLIIFMLGLLTVYPLDINELYIIFYSTIAILLIFELLRLYD